MFCYNYGQENPDSAAFCSNCGTRLIHKTDNLAKTPKEPEQVEFAAVSRKEDHKKGKRIWLWAGIAVFIIAIIAAALLLFLPSAKTGRPPVYVGYSLDDNVYLISGKNSVELDDADILGSQFINGMAGKNSEHLYYLAGADDGRRDLMQIRLNDDKAKPEKISDDVGNAEVSFDGRKILILKNVDSKTRTGDLYLWEKDDDVLIAESVGVNNFSFSPDGKSCTYVTAVISEDEETRTLYLQNKNTDPEIVTSFEPAEVILLGANVFDDGTVMYFLRHAGDDLPIIYLYRQGENERIDQGKLVVLFSSTEFMFRDDTSLFYYSTKNGIELISKNYYQLVFPDKVIYLDEPGYTFDPSLCYDRHFLLIESKDDEETFIFSEYTSDGKLIKITETDSSSCHIDASFSKIAYLDHEDNLYLASRVKDGWEDRTKVKNTINSSQFDTDGDNLYYITDDDDLKKYNLKTGESENILEDVAAFNLIGGRLLARTRDKELYLLANDGVIWLSDNILGYLEIANDGIVVIISADRFDLEYLAEESTKTVNIVYDADLVLFPYGRVVYEEDSDTDDEHEPAEGDRNGDVSETTPATETAETAETTKAEEPAEEEPDETEYVLPDESVIKDQELHEGIRRTLHDSGVSTGDFLIQDDLEKLTELKLYYDYAEEEYLPEGALINSEPIFDLQGLEYAINLSVLHLVNQGIDDISPLAGLPSLREIDVQRTFIDDISPLAGNTSIEHLYLKDSEVTDISIISELPNLRFFSAGPYVEDISPVYGLTNLENLSLSGESINDISGLANLTSLTWLILEYTEVSDISVVENLENLEALVIFNSAVEDISILQNLNNLQFVYLDAATYDANPETVAYLEDLGCSITKLSP